MFKKSIIALTVVALSAPFAGAAFANPGSDQMAAQLGLAPGAYTVNQMVQLQDARSENDAVREAFILSQGADFSSRADQSTGSDMSPGARQIAAIAGVAPGSLSVNQMIALLTARDANDSQTEAFILSGQGGADVGNDRGMVNPGKAQLAASLGLDPADYTTSELMAKFAALD